MNARKVQCDFKCYFRNKKNIKELLKDIDCKIQTLVDKQH